MGASIANAERLIALLGDRAPKFVYAFPGIAAGGIMLGANVDSMTDPLSPASNTEQAILRERVGGSDAKYACAELRNLDTRKTYTGTLCSLTKTAVVDAALSAVDPTTAAAIWLAPQIAERASGRAVDFATDEGLFGIKRMLGSVAQTIRDRLVDDPKRTRIMYTLLKNDPIISTYEQENPGGVKEVMDMMKYYAPNLSTNKSVVQSFLRNAAMAGGPMDYRSVKDLAEADNVIGKSRLANAWGTHSK